MLKVLFEGGKGSSVTLIETSKHNILVNTSSRDLRDVIIKRLEEEGLSVDDIDVVINTHLHPGHTGNNELFRNATIYASPNECVERCMGCLIYSHAQFKLTPVRELDDDEITIINTPGHTWGSISVLYRDYIIVGDAVPNREALISRKLARCVDEISARSSLNRIIRLGKNIITGHDGIIRADESL